MLSSIAYSQSNDSWIEMEFQFDGYAEEVSWGFYSSTDTISVDTGFYSEGQSNAYEL